MGSIVQESLPSVSGTFAAASKSNITTAVQLSTTSRPTKKGVTLTADESNPGPVYFGFASTVTVADSGVSTTTNDATTGEPIYAGRSVFVQVEDVSQIYVVASAASRVHWRTE